MKNVRSRAIVVFLLWCAFSIMPAGAVITQAYAPGLITAVVFYVPLGSLTLMRAFDQAARAQLARGIVAGVAVHALVFVLAFAVTRA